MIMDCEKFDKIVLDLLYQELDELGTAAAERHLDQCARYRYLLTLLPLGLLYLAAATFVVSLRADIDPCV